MHENNPFPPSISEYGKLRFGKKSDLLNLLQVETQPNPPPLFDVIAIDGAALVHMLPTATITTFDQYAELVFIPNLAGQLEVFPN